MNKLQRWRLERLCRILRSADAKHVKAGEPIYRQSLWQHPCGTPACALGHYAAHTPSRWKFGAYGQPHLSYVDGGPLESATIEFGISFDEAHLLFAADGCGEARTASEAANYIEAFIVNKATK